MNLLLDECMPRRTKKLLVDGGHSCQTVQEAGFSGEENGELLALAEQVFNVLVTIDKYPASAERHTQEDFNPNSPRYLE